MPEATSTSTLAARLATLADSLHPTERKVANEIASDPNGVLESTAQELADRLSVARSSVIRTCQRLGYRGYPQLRVALARQLAVAPPPPVAPDDALGALRADVARIAARLPESLGMLTTEVLNAAVTAIATSTRVLCVANGLSGPLAVDLALRLTATGRPAEYIGDSLGQQIAARQLTAEDTLVVISGSGANRGSLAVAEAAALTGATLIVITSFAATPLTELADVAIVIASVHDSFGGELEHPSRIAHTVFLHALLPQVAERLGAAGRAARDLVLEVLSDNLSDESGPRGGRPTKNQLS
ncbi:MurR/RpiR family transcriptional regulator [Nakamurella antarctica]|uniref:MurR/RpiR family transcriptional regulator n=1 Tax=Nakamurella antarctica TaxID=1902245 RepID=A0A3G8ZNL6_9ACTN|nr:MurR/RpiR family transcriptional regulator [Nakamurella antarctica]AZI58718.1 MurR/RpiR family transcriptional regulator [Nakamurella antarctica]